MPLPAPANQARFRDLLDQYGFAYIAMVSISGSSVA